MPIFHETRSGLTEAEIAALERDLGNVSLPADYRDFLRRFNGGWPEPNGTGFLRDGKPFGVMVDRFLETSGTGGGTVRDYRRVYDGRVPPELVPIAHDPGGNLICISVENATYGRIFYWDHDEEAEEDETPDYRNVYPMFDDFAAFLGSLRDR